MPLFSFALYTRVYNAQTRAQKRNIAQARIETPQFRTEARKRLIYTAEPINALYDTFICLFRVCIQ